MSGPDDDMIADRTFEGDKTRRMLSEELNQTERNGFAYIWEYLARPERLPPPNDWRVWMIADTPLRCPHRASPVLAGRGARGDSGRRKRAAGDLPP